MTHRFCKNPIARILIDTLVNRTFFFQCLLLASFVVASSNGRNKKHLSYLKNLVKSAIIGRNKINIQPQTDVKEENGYKVFQLPGYDDIVIKVSHKKPMLEEFVYPAAVENTNLNAFGSVVGTKTKDDTLVAMKEFNNLLSNVILYGGHNNVMKETVDPMFSLLNTRNYVVQEKIETSPVIEQKPVLKEVIESRPVLTEVVETRPILTEFVENRPVHEEVIKTKPVFTEVIRPLEERVELKVPFDPTYSYKQMQDNGSVPKYTAHNNPGVELLETLKTKTELPMCIKKRVDETIVLGADPNRFAPVQEVYQYKSQPVVDFSYPRIEANSIVQSADSSRFAPVQELYQHQTAPLIGFSYPSPEANSYVQNSFSEEVADYGFPPHRVRPLKDSPVRYNLGPRKTQAVNPRPVPLHSHKSFHFEDDISDAKDKVNSQIRKGQTFNYLGEKVDIAQTLGPIPPKYIIHVDNKTGNLAESNKKIMKAVPFVGSKDIIANAKIPVNVYKSQISPNTEKETKPLRTNMETSFNKYIATQTLAAEKDNAQEKNVVFTNKVTAKPSSVTQPIILASTNASEQPLRENFQTSFKNTPVIVKDNKGYSYQQKHADGSSMNVKGDKDGVAVNVKDNNNRGRGDIPD